MCNFVFCKYEIQTNAENLNKKALTLSPQLTCWVNQLCIDSNDNSLSKCPLGLGAEQPASYWNITQQRDFILYLILAGGH